MFKDVIRPKTQAQTTFASRSQTFGFESILLFGPGLFRSLSPETILLRFGKFFFFFSNFFFGTSKYVGLSLQHLHHLVLYDILSPSQLPPYFGSWRLYRFISTPTSVSFLIPKYFDFSRPLSINLGFNHRSIVCYNSPRFLFVQFLHNDNAW